MATETTLWKYLHPKFKALEPRSKFQRIESGGTGVGIPDVQYCIAGKAGWTELKILTVTNREKITLRIRKEQAIWLSEYCQADGRCSILAGWPKKSRGWIGFFVIPGKLAQWFFKHEGDLILTDLYKRSERFNTAREGLALLMQ